VSEPIFRSPSWVGAKGERLLSVRLGNIRSDGPQGARRAEDSPFGWTSGSAGADASWTLELRDRNGSSAAH
jgi:hypothetical protein